MAGSHRRGGKILMININDIQGFVEDCGNSIAYALGLL